jgi:hypothetical protein
MSDNGGRRLTIWDVVKVFFLWGVISALLAGCLVPCAFMVLDALSPPREGAGFNALFELAAGVIAAPIGFVIGGIAGVLWSPELR